MLKSIRTAGPDSGFHFVLNFALVELITVDAALAQVLVVETFKCERKVLLRTVLTLVPSKEIELESDC